MAIVRHVWAAALNLRNIQYILKMLARMEQQGTFCSIVSYIDVCILDRFT